MNPDFINNDELLQPHRLQVTLFLGMSALFTVWHMFVSKIVTVLAFNVLIITTVRTVAIVVSDFFCTLYTAGLLNSSSYLSFSIKDNFLEKLDNSKPN